LSEGPGSPLCPGIPAAPTGPISPSFPFQETKNNNPDKAKINNKFFIVFKVCFD